jgi:hypothetical protein
MTHRRGFFFMDAVAAILLLAVLMVVLLTTMGQRMRAGSRLADSREASRLAEKALLDLQQHRTVDAGDAGVTVTPLGNVEGVDRLQWTAVTATVNGRSVRLLGTVGRQP